MTITVEMLAGHANQRLLTSLPERAWMGRTGSSNPVAFAIKYDQQRRRRKDRLASCGLLLLYSALLFVVSALAESLDARLSGAGMFFGAVGLLKSISGLACAVQDRLELGSGLPSFCKDLSNLQEWLQHFSLNLWEQDDDGLMKAAREIMVEITEKILKLQTRPRETWHSPEHNQSKALDEELAKRYDTLWRLGLASGGYEKYYEEGKKRLAREATAIDGM